MKIVERLTPTGPDHIHYEALVSDPVTLTAPFKYDFPWTRNNDYVQYEYACIEGNEQTRGYIEGTSPYEAAKREAREKAREAGTLQVADPARVRRTGNADQTRARARRGRAYPRRADCRAGQAGPVRPAVPDRPFRQVRGRTGGA
jgi:hypothetical protein